MRMYCVFGSPSSTAGLGSMIAFCHIISVQPMAQVQQICRILAQDGKEKLGDVIQSLSAILANSGIGLGESRV